MKTTSIAGDETTGFYTPADSRPNEWPRLQSELLARIRDLPGLTPTASDVMEELGLALVTGADVLQPRLHGGRVAGQAVTLRYLPERRLEPEVEQSNQTSRLAHRSVLKTCMPGDVLVIDAAGLPVSAFGGMAALETSRCGVAGVIVDGAVRDLDEIEGVGLPVWSRGVTPRTGKFRLEAVQINAPVCCAGHQVIPGDVVLADATGVCFIPVELAERAIEAILRVAGSERDQLEQSG